MNRLNVLSIDWDYFVIADKNIRADSFPDAGNEKFPYSLQEIIWMTKYAFGNGNLKDVRTDSDALTRVETCLRNNLASINDACITESHAHAFPFIEEIYKNSGCYCGINLVNIDYHHDIYTHSDSSALTCGNWLLHIMKEHADSDNNFTWVARKDSDLGGTTKRFLDNVNVIYDDISIIDKYNWDAVFICRSNMWSPPHLDNDFLKTFGWLFFQGIAEFEDTISYSRFTDAYEEAIKEGKETLKTMNLNHR